MSLVAVANQEFKNKYNAYIRNALYLAVAIHVALFYVTPTFKFKPYVLRDLYGVGDVLAILEKCP